MQPQRRTVQRVKFKHALNQLTEKLEASIRSGGRIEKVNNIYFGDFSTLKKTTGLTKRKIEKWFPLRDQKLFENEEGFVQATNEVLALSDNMWEAAPEARQEFGNITVGYVMYYLPDGRLYAVFYKFRKNEKIKPAKEKVIAAMKIFLLSNPALAMQPGNTFSQCYTTIFETEIKQ